MHTVNKDGAVVEVYRIHGRLCKERLINLIVPKPAIQYESLLSQELPQETTTTHEIAERILTLEGMMISYLR